MEIKFGSSCGVSFLGKQEKQNSIPTLNYSEVQGRDKISWAEADRIINAGGDEAEKSKQKLIEARIPKTIENAKKFVSEHPEYSLDDLTQDLILVVVETMQKYEPRIGKNFNNVCEKNEELYLNKLLEKEEVETGSLEEFANFPTQTELDNSEKLTEALYNSITSLTPKKSAILCDVMGLAPASDGKYFEYKEPMTLDAVAKKYNVSHDFVRYTRDNALRDMRHPKISRPIKEAMESNIKL